MHETVSILIIQGGCRCEVLTFFFIRLLIQQIILISAPLHVVQIYPQCLFHPPQLGSQNWLGVVDVTVVLTTDINFFQT